MAHRHPSQNCRFEWRNLNGHALHMLYIYIMIPIIKKENSHLESKSAKRLFLLQFLMPIVDINTECVKYKYLYVKILVLKFYNWLNQIICEKLTLGRFWALAIMVLLCWDTGKRLFLLQFLMPIVDINTECVKYKYLYVKILVLKFYNWLNQIICEKLTLGRFWALAIMVLLCWDTGNAFGP